MRPVKKYYWVFIIIMILISITGCIETSENGDKGDQKDEGYTNFDASSMSEMINSMPKESLSIEEEIGILFMREEEKLAKDVYLTLYDKWSKNIFSNIANAEETHTQSLELLIIKYNLTDPFIDEVGSFQNQTLQSLYFNLVENGSTSLIDALIVGALIEEIDIIDILDYLEVNDNQDITFIYENLMMGSRNHLRAFVSNLDKEGVSYSPKYLSQTEFEDIIEAEMESNQYRT